jgi:hypothetical protein
MAAPAGRACSIAFADRRANAAANRTAPSPLSASTGLILNKRPRLPRYRASSPIPRLRHKLHSDCRLNARITTIRILVRIFVQYLTTLRTQKIVAERGSRIGRSRLPPGEGDQAKDFRKHARRFGGDLGPLALEFTRGSPGAFPCGEDQEGGSRRPARRASDGGAFDNLAGPRDPHPCPPPQEGAGALTSSIRPERRRR